MRKCLPIAIILQSLVLLTNAQLKVKKEVIYGKLERITAPVKSYESFTKTPTGIFKTEVLNEKNTERVVTVTIINYMMTLLYKKVKPPTHHKQVSPVDLVYRNLPLLVAGTETTPHR